VLNNSSIFNSFRGAVTIKNHTETSGSFTFVYGVDAADHKWANITQTGNIAITLSTTIPPPNGAYFYVSSPPNLGGFTFTVSGISLGPSQNVMLRALGGAWQGRDAGKVTTGYYVYTFANIGQAPTNAIIIVSNGRKIGEGAGAGTGVPAYYSGGQWRVLSSDQPVTA